MSPSQVLDEGLFFSLARFDLLSIFVLFENFVSYQNIPPEKNAHIFSSSACQGRIEHVYKYSGSRN